MMGILTEAGGASMGYVDDVITASESVQANICDVDMLLKAMRKHGAKLKLAKCNFGFRHIKWLGISVTADGISIDQDRVQALRDMKAPTNVHELRRFIGMVQFNAIFLPMLSATLCPLLELLQKRVKFVWSNECQRSFDRLIRDLTNATTLSIYADSDTAPLRLRIWSDASKGGLGASAYARNQDGSFRPLGYISRRLTKAEEKWHPIELEAAAMHFALFKLRPLVHGVPDVILFTDHKPNEALLTSHTANPRLSKISLQILETFPDVRIVWTPGGASNAAADACSRMFPRPKKSDAARVGAVQTRASLKRHVGSDATGDRDQQLQTTRADKPPALEDDGLDAVFPFIGRPGEALRDEVQRYKFAETEMRQRQESCEETRAVLRTAESGFDPSLSLIRGVLHKKLNGGWRPFIPCALRPRLLHFAHDDCLAGAHSSAGKMQSKLERWGYFPGLQRAAKEWSRACSICAGLNAPQKKVHPPFIPLIFKRRLSHWALDLITGLPTTPDGSTALLAMQDTVTKMPLLVPLKSIDAEHVTIRMWERCYSLFGLPLSLVSDGGSQFCSSLSKSVAQAFAFGWEFSSPYHQSANGQIESTCKQIWRVHQAASWMPLGLRQGLLGFVGSSDTWDQRCNLLLMSMRASDHSTTRRSPAELCFGQRIRLPPDTLLDMRSSYSEEPSSLEELVQVTQAGERLAVEAIREAQDSRKEARDRGVHMPFRVGDRVRERIDVHPPGSKIFRRRWKGPMTILAMDPTRNAAQIRICHQLDADPYWVNVERLKISHELVPGMLREPEHEKRSDQGWGRYGRRARSLGDEQTGTSARLREQRLRVNEWYREYADQLKTGDAGKVPGTMAAVGLLRQSDHFHSHEGRGNLTRAGVVTTGCCDSGRGAAGVCYTTQSVHSTSSRSSNSPLQLHTNLTTPTRILMAASFNASATAFVPAVSGLPPDLHKAVSWICAEEDAKRESQRQVARQRRQEGFAAWLADMNAAAKITTGFADVQRVTEQRLATVSGALQALDERVVILHAIEVAAKTRLSNIDGFILKLYDVNKGFEGRCRVGVEALEALNGRMKLVEEQAGLVDKGFEGRCRVGVEALETLSGRMKLVEEQAGLVDAKMKKMACREAAVKCKMAKYQELMQAIMDSYVEMQERLAKLERQGEEDEEDEEDEEPVLGEEDPEGRSRRDGKAGGEGQLGLGPEGRSLRDGKVGGKGRLGLGSLGGVAVVGLCAMGLGVVAYSIWH
jgi:hypothetical protein